MPTTPTRAPHGSLKATVLAAKVGSTRQIKGAYAVAHKIPLWNELP